MKSVTVKEPTEAKVRYEYFCSECDMSFFYDDFELLTAQSFVHCGILHKLSPVKSKVKIIQQLDFSIAKSILKSQGYSANEIAHMLAAVENFHAGDMGSLIKQALAEHGKTT